MGKRPSNTERHGRVAKMAKVDAEFAPLAEVFFHEPHLPFNCQEMLCAALPHAIRSKPEERHPYEKQLVDLVMGMCKSRAERQRAEVDSEQKELLTLKESQARLVAELAEATTLASTKAEIKDAKAGNVKDFTASVEDAERTVLVEMAKDAARVEEQTAVVSEQSQYQEVLDGAWKSLREATFVGHYKEKQKAIAKLTGMLEASKAPASLTSALTLALKQKAEKRSVFAEKSVDYAEGMLKDYIQSLVKTISDLEQKGADVKQSIENAKAAKAAAEERLHSAQNESIGAENEWASAESDVVTKKSECERLQQQGEDAEKILAESKDLLASVLDLSSKIEDLRDHKTQQVEAVEVPNEAAVPDATQAVADVPDVPEPQAA